MATAITHPAVILREFVEACRALSPTIAISPRTNHRIHETTEDIIASRKVRAVKNGQRFKLHQAYRSKKEIRCSRDVLDFSDKLGARMREWKVWRVSHARAAELLCNFEECSDFEQAPCASPYRSASDCSSTEFAREPPEFSTQRYSPMHVA
ncbi:hypothetical protein [Pararhizobium mangrovi]|uniref:Uncharacterized protein n=1 Tax=Pararhizobium mangrovi TaxID=2590452 RepID=A0A506UGU5_9HYPH|nr:hypothetical protein [Pararhizobium mangrovi]TPW32654.1 hypothetical protein FJU11_00015 [Pararhizobium mangrovi]